MGFQAVAFLPSRASFSATFLMSCAGECFGSTTCHVVGGRQGHAPCNILLLKQSLFVSVEFNVYHKTVTQMRYNLATLNFWGYWQI